ncbi:efflux RND transporter periplasmic adaptor subunit [Virgibacillus sp. MSJ-26]|uniref:efflux RND transporter periplasmic adaptor subunit n=1 Tax=Virgibacillus sp. MSJ-26 TaxID=2841522 RepID=UPI001C0FFE54|nr:efflux RND transporter periplasmic adaptor subunit [Virgibacillus sp. MSJ-26]MBU5468060.1 efflux RND transporter periplasmic adaptor subunit [Virgibacillus sp. MSJ-26]
MRLTRKHKMSLVLAVLFVLTNVLLIYIDKEQKVAKTSHIKEWTEVTEQDMYESVDTTGVLDFSEESFIYFDDSLGEFQSFMIEEGQQVHAGEDLYSYEVRNYYETAAQLEGEMEKLDGEITAIEAAITKMESYQIPSSTSSAPAQANSLSSMDDDTDEDENSMIKSFLEEMTQVQDTGQAELIKEQYITEKEKELAQKEAEQTSVETQLSELTATGETVTVESPYDGVVTNISETLEDPLITVQSAELVVKGELKEQDHSKVEPEQTVYITMAENDSKEEGLIEEVDEIPDEISLKGKSKYPFIATLLDEEIQDENQGAEQEDFEEEQDDQDLDQNQDEDQDSGKGLEINESDDESKETETVDEQEKEEEEDKLFPGYHADLEIITKESSQASVVDEKDLDDSGIWLMTPKGTIIKNPVEIGIEMDSLIEITEGAEVGEWIAIDPQDRFTSPSPFITSLDVKTLNAKRLKSDRWFKDLMTGFISR